MGEYLFKCWCGNAWHRDKKETEERLKDRCPNCARLVKRYKDPSY